MALWEHAIHMYVGCIVKKLSDRDLVVRLNEGSENTYARDRVKGPPDYNCLEYKSESTYT